MKKISIIVPTYNEAPNVHRVLARLRAGVGDFPHELFVIDGGSTDDTMMLAKAAGATVFLAPQKGRNNQMNFGATKASGDVLYFVHADTVPPLRFIQDIQQSITNGAPIGCYRFKFDSERWLLKINAYFTRFDKMWCRGGDQTLYITRQLFDELGGYCSKHQIMEEYELMSRARQQCKFNIMDGDVLVSARKYESNGYLKVQVANLVVFNMYRLGFSQDRMARFYRRMLG